MMDIAYVGPHSLIPIRVRAATHHDAENASALAAESFAHCTPNVIRKWLQQRSRTTLIAERGSAVVGLVSSTLVLKTLTIDMVVVHANIRRQTIGTALVNETIARALKRKDQCRIAETWVHETNVSAQLFFKHHGFLYTRTMRNPLPRIGDDTYVMQRKFF